MQWKHIRKLLPLFICYSRQEKKRKLENLALALFCLFPSLPSFPLFSSFFFFVIEFKKNLSFHKFISPFAFLLKIVLKYIFWFCMRNNKGGNLRNDYFWRGKGEGRGGGGLAKQSERSRFSRFSLKPPPMTYESSRTFYTFFLCLQI